MCALDRVTNPGVLAFAPRSSPRLRDAVVRLDDRRVPIAEVARRVGDEADRLALPRPSYQRVRELVREARRLQDRGPATTEVLVEVAMRARPFEAAVQQLAGVPVRKLP